MPDGTLTLAPGLYDGETFALDPHLLPSGGGPAELDAAVGAGVTFGASSSITLSDDPPGGFANAPPPTGNLVALGGAGAMVNDGTITSDFANAGSFGLAISVASFTNAGFMSFAPMTSQDSGTFPTWRGSHGLMIDGTLNWTQEFAPTLAVSSALFVNLSVLGVSGGTLDITGAGFDNEGTLVLSDVTAETVAGSGGLFGIVPQTLTTAVEFGAGVTSYTNNGTIIADLVRFDGAVALAALGRVQGALAFAGTLDLGGATLDASSYGTVTISGTVRNGTLAAGTGTLALDGATLDAVAVAPGGVVTATGPITQIDPPAAVASVTLDATTTELGFAAEAGVASLDVTAGSTAVTDAISLLGAGPYTFGPGFTLNADIAGSTVDVTGATTLTLDGNFGIDAATLDIAPTLAGTGTLTLADGAAVTLEAVAPGASLTVVFGAGPALLVVPDNGAGLTIDGLHDGDLVDFTAVSDQPGTLFAAPGATISGGALDVTGASGDTARVPVIDPAGGLTFQTAIDPGGGTLVTATACFRAGTRIAVPGGEAAVERLAIGDAVLTASGAARRIRWLGRRRYAAAQVAAERQVRPVRIEPGALAPGIPRRALEISPEHALLFGGVLIPAGALVNGVSITRAEDAREVVYVHVELAEHALILAEGAAAETFVPLAGRALFDNAAEYAALYPNAAGPLRVLPRAECGEAVARVRQLLAARAGIGEHAAAPGALRGHVERIAGGVLEGWACDVADPSRSLAFELLVGGRAAGRVVANRYRADLDRHGLPACGFRARMPPGAPVLLRRVDDGTKLPIAPDARAA